MGYGGRIMNFDYLLAKSERSRTVYTLVPERPDLEFPQHDQHGLHAALGVRASTAACSAGVR